MRNMQMKANSGASIIDGADRGFPEISTNGEALLTVREVAAMLRVPVSWVYEHVRPGCSDPLPHLRLGKYLRFSVADISEYVRSLRTRR